MLAYQNHASDLEDGEGPTFVYVSNRGIDEVLQAEGGEEARLSMRGGEGCSVGHRDLQLPAGQICVQVDPVLQAPS